MSWWKRVILLLSSFFSGLLLILLISRMRRLPRQPGNLHHIQDQLPPEQELPELADDLRRIDGIGPKIASTLNTLGIMTYAQLASHKPDELKQILQQAGINLAFPDTWPEQASLAAAGDWVKLRDFQAQLKGGRRV